MAEFEPTTAQNTLLTIAPDGETEGAVTATFPNGEPGWSATADPAGNRLSVLVVGPTTSTPAEEVDVQAVLSIDGDPRLGIDRIISKQVTFRAIPAGAQTFGVPAS